MHCFDVDTPSDIILYSCVTCDTPPIFLSARAASLTSFLFTEERSLSSQLPNLHCCLTNTAKSILFQTGTVIVVLMSLPDEFNQDVPGIEILYLKLLAHWENYKQSTKE